MVSECIFISILHSNFHAKVVLWDGGTSFKSKSVNACSSITAYSLVEEGEKDVCVWRFSDLCEHQRKRVTEGLVHKYKNTTIIKSDSIKVFTVQHIQQIIAPNWAIVDFVMRERRVELDCSSSLRIWNACLGIIPKTECSDGQVLRFKLQMIQKFNIIQRRAAKQPISYFGLKHIRPWRLVFTVRSACCEMTNIEPEKPLHLSFPSLAC